MLRGNITRNKSVRLERVRVSAAEQRSYKAEMLLHREADYCIFNFIEK